MLRRTQIVGARKLGRLSKKILKKEQLYGAHNYNPLPVVFAKARGCVVTDPEGNHHLDFLSGYGAVSQGHLHPKLKKVLIRQLGRCTLSSRAFYNDRLGEFQEYITKLFKYDKVLPMNTGAEGVETALKLARKWGYKVKKIPDNKALIGCVTENFHGRTFGAIALSSDPSSFENYGPKLPGIRKTKFGSIPALRKFFNTYGKRLCGFIIEPIQGEAGIIIPPEGYLREVRRLCTKHKVLYIDDEVQAGCGRTGKMLAVEHEGVRPDVVVLAKALGGGVLPVAAVLADAKIMDVIEPGTHGSTFGGNPLAAAIGVEALKVLTTEGMVANSARQGKKLLRALEKLKAKYPFVKDVRGRGLFCAIEIKHHILGGKGGNFMMRALQKQRLLSKVTHSHTLRLTPPLVISDRLLAKAIQRIDNALAEMEQEIANTKSISKSGKK